MASELRDQIVHLVDAEAPPIDVAVLARHLAHASVLGAVDEVLVTATAHPMDERRWRRNGVAAFAMAFASVTAVVGSALALGAWLNRTSVGPVGGTEGLGATSPSGIDVWWFVVGAVAIGVGAFVAWRRRPTAGEEPVMQTLERTEQPRTDPAVEHLTSQRRWLIIALALVLVVAAVAIGWLIAENRSLEAPAALTASQERNIAVSEELFDVLNGDDIGPFAELHHPNAIIRDDGGLHNVESWRDYLSTFVEQGSWQWTVVDMMAFGDYVVTAFTMGEPSAGPGARYVHVARFNSVGKIMRSETFTAD